MSLLAKDLKAYLAALADDAPVWIEDGQLCAVQLQVGMLRLDVALTIGGEYEIAADLAAERRESIDA